MVRTFAERPVERALIDSVIDAGRRAPSAGFSQGSEFVVLEGTAETEAFWALTAPTTAPEPGGRWDTVRRAPAIILPLAHRQAYLDRYAEPDKAGRGLDRAAAWTVPYWLLDTAFAAMSMLLAATDVGLGALFFGLGRSEHDLLAHLGVPSGYETIGAIALGWPAPADPPSRSIARGRRDRSETVHYGRWTAPS
jgi:nitroreductase